MNEKVISLFIPCLVDQVYPEMGIAMCQVLDNLGFKYSYNPEHTCCGQPAFNSGQRGEARKVAARFIRAFAEAEVIVSVSGSCTAMVKNYYPELFAGTNLLEDAKRISSKVFEFSQFLVKSGAVEKIEGSFSGKIGYHNSCHSQRELRVVDEPYQVLQRIKCSSMLAPDEDPVCCGFGGVFCVKFPDISEAMTKKRIAYFLEQDVDTIVVNDVGCIMQMRKQAEADGYAVKILHLVEFLAQAMGLASALPEQRTAANRAV